MIKRAAIALAGIVGIWAVMSLAGLGLGSANAASQPAAVPQTTVLADLNRADCEAIRGTDYLSDEERAWFLAYCIGDSGAAYAPEVIYVYVPVYEAPLPPPPPPPPPSRPVAPAVRITCASVLGSVTAQDDQQNVPLNTFAGAPINCAADVAGSYSTIDWAGGFTNGSGANFTTSFGYRTLPWTIRVQVNWGGNPVIKYISVTTVGAQGCLPQPGYVVCIP